MSLVAGLALAAPSLIKGASKLFNKPPSLKVGNDTTAYLNKLRNVSKEGLYGADVQNEVGTEIAKNSENTRTALRGNAVKQGIENSGVLAQQLIQEGGKTTLQAAKMAKQIAKMNEDSKLRASSEASAVGKQIEDVRYQNSLNKYTNKMSAFGDIVDGASAGYSGYSKKKTNTDNSELFEYLMDVGDVG
tara:strand:+ start:2995 stop:3561 length:567 start_codon:yes stop_codon:yes gene_type:complete